VEKKAFDYIDYSDGKIQLVFIIDLQYPGMKKAWVSLLASGDSASPGALQFETFLDDDLDLDQQPDGQVALYLSDFLGPTGLPETFCRPSIAELAAGVARFVCFPFFVSATKQL
jgi:hypothetical protein